MRLIIKITLLLLTATMMFKACGNIAPVLASEKRDNMRIFRVAIVYAGAESARLEALERWMDEAPPEIKKQYEITTEKVNKAVAEQQFVIQNIDKNNTRIIVGVGQILLAFFLAMVGCIIPSKNNRK